MRDYRLRGEAIPFFVIDQRRLDIPFCECLKTLRVEFPAAKSLVLDYQKSRDEIVRLLILGAQGFMAHANVSDALCRALLCVAAGQLWVPPEVLEEYLRKVGHVIRKDRYHRESKTPRENEILELVRKHLSNQEIANRLEILVSTVKFHVANIFSKLHASSRRELADAPFRGLGRTLPQ